MHRLTNACSTFWDQSESIAEGLPEAEAYLVRARYRLAQCYELAGDEDVGRAWKQSADTAHVEYMTKRGCPAIIPNSLEGLYDGEVAWMLW